MRSVKLFTRLKGQAQELVNDFYSAFQVLFIYSVISRSIFEQIINLLINKTRQVLPRLIDTTTNTSYAIRFDSNMVLTSHYASQHVYIGSQQRV